MRKISEETERQRGFLVVKANELVQKARYDLNIRELKILAFIFSKVKPTDAELQEYTFSVRDFCTVCGIEERSGMNYANIKASLKGLRDKSFWVTDENGHDVLIGWLSKARINRGNGKIAVKLDEDMQKFVIGLFQNYTQYELLSTLPMKSAYSFRIYELLKSYAFTGSHTFEVEELKRMLTAEHFQNFKDFRRRVIEIAVREINLYTDILTSWEPITYGRKVTHIKFRIMKRSSWGRYLTAQNANAALDGQMSIFDYMDEKNDVDGWEDV